MHDEQVDTRPTTTCAEHRDEDAEVATGGDDEEHGVSDDRDEAVIREPHLSRKRCRGGCGILDDVRYIQFKHDAYCNHVWPFLVACSVWVHTIEMMSTNFDNATINFDSREHMKLALVYSWLGCRRPLWYPAASHWPMQCFCYPLNTASPAVFDACQSMERFRNGILKNVLEECHLCTVNNLQKKSTIKLLLSVTQNE